MDVPMCGRNGYVQACSYFCIAARNNRVKIVNTKLMHFHSINFSIRMQTTYSFTFFLLDYVIVQSCRWMDGEKILFICSRLMECFDGPVYTSRKFRAGAIEKELVQTPVQDIRNDWLGIMQDALFLGKECVDKSTDRAMPYGSL